MYQYPWALKHAYLSHGNELPNQATIKTNLKRDKLSGGWLSLLFVAAWPSNVYALPGARELVHIPLVR